MATQSITSTVDPDTSIVTTSIVEYSGSPRVRHRHQVTWSVVDDERQSHASCDFDVPTDDDQVSVDDLETSPSMVRRRREQRKRRRRRQRKERVEEEQFAVSNDQSSSCVSTQLLRNEDFLGDGHDLNELVEIRAAVGRTTSVNGGDLSDQSTDRELNGGTTRPNLPTPHCLPSQATTTPASAALIDNGKPGDQHRPPTSNPGSRAASFRRLDFPAQGRSREARSSGLPFNVSIWMLICLCLLFLSNGLFLVAFVTQSWGQVDIVRYNLAPSSGNTSGQQNGVSTSVRWNFGLWRCCRDDGICLGTRWPVFYSVCRTFAVLALFGQALTFTLIFGHSAEKLLDYDPCTMLSLVSSCFITAAFIIIDVSVYGAIWPSSFRQILQHATLNSTTTLGYSFYLAMASAPLLTVSGVLALLDLKSSRKAFQVRHNFAEVLDDDDDDDYDGYNDVSYNFDVINGTYFRDDLFQNGAAITENYLDNQHRLPYLDRSSLWHEESLI